MGTLLFKKVTRDVENIQFECGVGSINEYVRNSYFPTILQHAYTYSIMKDNKILGYYQVLFREIELTDFPDDIAEFESLIKDGKISSLHIRFIAIDELYQNHRIGTSTLKIIIKNVEELAKQWPIRVITIDARIDLYEWYKRMGFSDMKNNTPGQDGVTIAMYFDCMKYERELNDYIESII